VIYLHGHAILKSNAAHQRGLQILQTVGGISAAGYGKITNRA
jgi:hypothetical protein